MNACVIIYADKVTAVVTNVPDTTSSKAILRKWLDWQGIPTDPPWLRGAYIAQLVPATSVVESGELAKK